MSNSQVREHSLKYVWRKLQPSLLREGSTTTKLVIMISVITAALAIAFIVTVAGLNYVDKTNHVIIRRGNILFESMEIKASALSTILLDPASPDTGKIFANAGQIIQVRSRHSLENIRTPEMSGRMTDILAQWKDYERESKALGQLAMKNPKTAKEGVDPLYHQKFIPFLDALNSFIEKEATLLDVATRSAEQDIRAVKWSVSFLIVLIAAIVLGMVYFTTRSMNAYAGALRQSEARYRELFDNASDFVYTSDLGGIFTSVNKTLCDGSGYNSDELIGASIAKLVSPSSIEKARQMTEAKLKGVTSFTNYEIEIIAKNGEAILVEVHSRLIKENGKPVGVQGIGRDIGERRKAEIAKKEQLSFIEQLINTIPNPVFYKDDQGRYLGCNQAFEQFIGKTRKEIVGQTVYDISPKDLADRYYAADKTLYDKPGVQVYEAKVQSADGVFKDVMFNKATFTKSGGKLGGLVGVMTDVTEHNIAEEKLRKAKEEAEAATKLKDKFISLLSHDLRAPLSTVILLQKVTMSNHGATQCAECKTMLGKSIKVCETMLEMADDLLESARLQTGAIQLNRKLCHVRDICTDVVEDVNELAVKKEIVLRNEVPEDVRFYADRVLFQRVVHNLVVNALKFSKKGDVVTFFMPEGKKKNRLAVKDTGTGISGKLLPDLFKHEVKTTTTGTSGERGTGFGLPMSMEIVKAHGGTIEAISPKGEGATFFIEMPEIKPLVLVADDDENSTFVLGKYLENLGADVLKAKNGAEALEIVQMKEPVLILTDIRMPVMDGLALLQRLKAEAKFSNIPVIIITGSYADDIAMRQKAFEYKADDFIVKPLSEADFMPRINRFIAS